MLTLFKGNKKKRIENRESYRSLVWIQQGEKNKFEINEILCTLLIIILIECKRLF